MNARERFQALMSFRPVDRLPVYYFGTWPETKVRWRQEGLTVAMNEWGNAGPQMPGMDTDWESSPDQRGEFWDNQGLLEPWPRSQQPVCTLAEDDDTRTVRTALGGRLQLGKRGSTIPHVIEPDLKPTREDWARFKRFLDPADPGRWRPGWEQRVEWLNQRDHMTCFFGGSLFGWMRDWLGVEAVSYLPYDDPALYEEIIAFQADYYIELNRPLLQRVSFDFAYIFEDCCFNTGPLISPEFYRRYYDRYYRKMIAAYREMGVPLILLDSDGKVDDLLPCWLDTGFDIIFPIEVGTWRASPVELRRRYGKRLRMLGGVDKHVIPRGEAAIRAELEPLRPVVEEGGYLPIPDHRIPPDCSLEQFQTYVRVFQDVFSK
jgi:uroporphyrinogen decarboxylase